MFVKTDFLGRAEIKDGQAAYVPRWWNRDDGGPPARPEDVLHEIRDRMGLYFMKKKLRHDLNMASRQPNTDEKTRNRMLTLLSLVDKFNPTPEEGKMISSLYRKLENDPTFNTELKQMMSLIRYG